MQIKLKNRQAELQAHCDKYGLKRDYSRELVQEQVAKRSQNAFTSASKNVNINRGSESKRLKIDLQLFAKKPSDYETVFLPKDEYGKVMHEVATNASKEQLSKKLFSKCIGDYVYTFENLGDDFRVIDKEKLK